MKDLEEVLQAVMAVAGDPDTYAMDTDAETAQAIDAAGMMLLIAQVCSASSATIRTLAGDRMDIGETLITEAGTQVRVAARGGRELIKAAELHADARQDPELMQWLIREGYIDSPEIRKATGKDPQKNITLDIYDL